jgi:hypothetical protein
MSDREADVRGEEAWEGVPSGQRDRIESEFFASLLTFLQSEGVGYFIADLPFHGEAETLLGVASTTRSTVTARDRELVGELNKVLIETLVQLNPAVLTLRDKNRDRLYITDSWTTAHIVLDRPGIKQVQEMVRAAHSAATLARDRARSIDR